jgi:hypothetical protein
MARAGMDNYKIVDGKSLANAAATTNAMVVRGTVDAIVVKITDCASAVRTNTVSIVSDDGQTVFSLACVGTSTNTYPIKTPTYSTAGAALLVGSAPAGATNILYTAMAVASKLTCTVTGSAFPTLTNTVTVGVIFRN